MSVRERIVPVMAAALMLAGLGGAAWASQTVDPCYKLCFMSGNYRTAAARQDCSRRCRASDRYVCDSRCFRRFPNSPRELLACRKSCVGLPGGW